MNKLVGTLFFISTLISVLFAGFVLYGFIENSLLDSDKALPLISIWAFRVSELLIDYYKGFFYLQLTITGALAYLFFFKKK